MFYQAATVMLQMQSMGVLFAKRAQRHTCISDAPGHALVVMQPPCSLCLIISFQQFVPQG